MLAGQGGNDYLRATITRITMTEEILQANRAFVQGKGYEPYLTSKFPDKKLAILSCMDTRLTTLLPAALGLKNGDAKIIKNAGGLVPSPWDSAMRSLLVGVYELGVERIMVVHHSQCGACHMTAAEMKHLMLERGIAPETLSTVERSGIDLDQWLEGFHDTERSVRDTVQAIRRHPLLPADVRIQGFIIDSATGELTQVTEVV